MHPNSFNSYIKEKRAGETIAQSPERVLEDSFMLVLQSDILESFSSDLEEAGFSPAQEEEFRKELSKLSLQDVGRVLSMPYELRKVRMPKLLARLQDGTSMKDLVSLLVQEAKERGFMLGYHMSNSEIFPRTDKRGVESWTIDGRERDHRDNDLPMAYYSISLGHLYGRKKARFLYVVRAELGSGTTHKQDNDGTWGRAAKLDIVGKLDYEKVMEEARKQVNGLFEKK